MGPRPLAGMGYGAGMNGTQTTGRYGVWGWDECNTDHWQVWGWNEWNADHWQVGECRILLTG